MTITIQPMNVFLLKEEMTFTVEATVVLEDAGWYIQVTEGFEGQTQSDLKIGPVSTDRLDEVKTEIVRLRKSAIDYLVRSKFPPPKIS